MLKKDELTPAQTESQQVNGKAPSMQRMSSLELLALLLRNPTAASNVRTCKSSQRACTVPHLHRLAATLPYYPE